MSTTPEQLLRDALAAYGIDDCGIAFGTPETPVISHDRRGAPFAVDERGVEIRELLVSDTDEGDERILAWARVPQDSEVVGLGIDLASTEDFQEDCTGNRFSQYMLTGGERFLVRDMDCPVPVARTRVFAAKESGFKSTSAALRRWDATRDELLRFGVRDFELKSGSIVRGTARKWAAEKACARIGVGDIVVSFCMHKDMVFCVAVALRRREA